MISLLVFSTLLQACGEDSASLPTSVSDVCEDSSVILGKTEDMGDDYIDSFIFFGESTTYHLKSRGVLSGGTATTQVLGDASGTVNLDPSTADMKIIYPDTGELMSLFDAVALKKPRYMLLTFGLNGAVSNVKRGREYYQACYLKLINKIRAASPSTKIILQSCFPVAKNMDMSNYSVSLEELNECISTINGWVCELADREGLRYLNTCEVLTDRDGRLKLEYQSGDGHHLTREAYLIILKYIRTHGYK